MNNRNRGRILGLLGVIAGAGAFLVLLETLLIQPEQLTLNLLKLELAHQETRIQQAKDRGALRGRMQAAMIASSNDLSEAELSMASGDVYLWLVRTFEQLQQTHQFRLDEVSAPDVAPADTLPRVPYKSARVTLNGEAGYHDLGLFLAAVENKYPFLRLERLDMNSAGGRQVAGTAEERLLKVEIELSILARP